MKKLQQIQLIGLFSLLGNLANCMDAPTPATHISLDSVNEALINAVYMEKKEVVDVLLSLGANPNTPLPSSKNTGWTIVHYAAITGNLSILKRLLHYHANVNAQSKHGYTPLHLAVTDRNAKIIKKLIQAGADPKLKNNVGLSPIDLAMQSREPELVAIMMSNVR